MGFKRLKTWAYWLYCNVYIAILAGHYDDENIAFFLKLNEKYFIKKLNLKYGTPSPDTLLRIYSLIDPGEFMKIFVK